jgi:hypothetical protein
MLDIKEATYEELKTTREEITVRIRDMERAAVAELEQRAAQFGFSLSKAEIKPQKRKRRTRAEIEATHTTQPPPLSVIR